MAEKLHSVINTYVQILIDTVRATGVERETILKPFEGDISSFEEPGQRLSMTRVTELWLWCVELSNDRDLGLHVGENVRPGSFHIVTPVLMNSPTLADGLELMVRYQGLVSEGGTLSREVTSTGLRIIYTPHAMSIPMTRYQVEGIFSSVVHFIRWLLAREFIPERVCFAHTVNHDREEYVRIFKCPVLFGQERHILSLNTEHLNTRIPQSDPELLRHHQKIADGYLENLNRGKKLSQMLRDWLQERENFFTASLEKAASYLKMSPRTLQRQLRKEGVAYLELHREVVMETARFLLLYTDKSNGEISEELGYINLSSFYRGFKRFYGKTPTEYRRYKRSVQYRPDPVKSIPG
jgi:AraC-like DNA-binding protein